MKKRLFLLFILLMPIKVLAKDGDINSSCKITANGIEQNILLDSNYKTSEDYNKTDTLTISCEKDISYVYIYYNIDPYEGSIQTSKKTYNIGQSFLHELIKLDTKEKELTLSFKDDYSLADIYLFSDNLPSWVESWHYNDKADMMLFSTHADDEQLFFAGLMPTYIDKGYNIQVVYFTNHYNDTNRYHELLEGLWAVGITGYPEVSTFPDAYSESLQGAINNLKAAGYTEDDAMLYMVRAMRKYKPYVVVGHDEKGEYSHGQHILNTYILKDAILKTKLEDYDEESLKEYVPHQISKLYLHLYEQNQIVLDYDTPLTHFNGKTAYEVSKEGYAKHLSQQYTWFTAWLKGPNDSYTKASQITKYSPCFFGLYYTNVGDDRDKNDMFENIVINKPSDNPTPPESNPKTNKEKEKKTLKFTSKYFILGSSLIGVSFFGIIIILLSKKKK